MISRDELWKLNFILSNNDTFCCCFIVVDNYEEIVKIKDRIDAKFTIVDNCKEISDLIIVKDRVMMGEKIILTNLDSLYEICAKKDTYYQDGIYQFYQRFTEVYRDRLWLNRKGQLHFVLTEEQYEQFYTRGNHFKTMLTTTLDFTKKKVLSKSFT